MGLIYKEGGYGQGLSTALNPTVDSPLDVRTVVLYRDDLTNPNTWIGSPRYYGMIVSVIGDTSDRNGLYWLRDDGDTNGDGTGVLRFTIIGPEGWLKIGSGDGSIIVDNISIKGEGTILNPYHVALIDGGGF